MNTGTASGRVLATILLVAMLIALAIRLRLVDVPFERDEGEYAYAGQLILQGVPPFAEAYNMKMPGIYVAYAAVLAVFGQTHRAVHVGLILVNLLTALLLYALFRRLFDREIGVLGAAAYVLLSVVPHAQGIVANAEHFVLLFAAGGLVVLLDGIGGHKRSLIFTAGLLLGVAFLMKQHAVFFIAFGGLLLVSGLLARPSVSVPRRATTAALFAAGLAIPFSLTCLFLWRAGVFDRFWFWAYEYGREYVSQAPVSYGMKILGQRIAELFGDSPLFWILALVGLASPLWSRAKKGSLIALYAFVVLAFLATCPGLFFRRHYFILFLPAVALLSAVGVSTLAKRAPVADRDRRGVLVVLIVAAVLLQLVLGAPTYFTRTPEEVSRSFYGGNPFPESVEIGRFIRENSSASDTIAVLGSEPQIYFYAKRRSATGYIYTYALMEAQPFARQMQEEMIEQIETGRPKFIVVVNVRASWLEKRASEPALRQWMPKYLQANYLQVDSYPHGTQRPTLDLWERRDS
jgi:4-amino-4-deoxy-L-arabinose transferase-like glycosyltransferase